MTQPARFYPKFGVVFDRDGKVLHMRANEKMAKFAIIHQKMKMSDVKVSENDTDSLWPIFERQGFYSMTLWAAYGADPNSDFVDGEVREPVGSDPLSEMRFEEDPQEFKHSVNELYLGMRYKQALIKGGFKTIGDLATTSKSAILRCPSIGRKGLEKIEAALIVKYAFGIGSSKRRKGYGK